MKIRARVESVKYSADGSGEVTLVAEGDGRWSGRLVMEHVSSQETWRYGLGHPYFIHVTPDLTHKV